MPSAAEKRQVSKEKNARIWQC